MEFSWSVFEWLPARPAANWIGIQQLKFNVCFAESDKSITDIITGYLSEIEKLKARLIESDQMYLQLKKANQQRVAQRGNVSYSDGKIRLKSVAFWDLYDEKLSMNGKHFFF